MDSSGNKKKNPSTRILHFNWEILKEISKKNLISNSCITNLVYIQRRRENIPPNKRLSIYTSTVQQAQRNTITSFFSRTGILANSAQPWNCQNQNRERERNFRELSNRIQRIIQKLVSKSARELELHFHASVRTGPSYRPFPAEKTGEGGKKEREVSKSGRNEFNF